MKKALMLWIISAVLVSCGGDAGVGTSVGNPTVPAANSLTFQTTAIDDSNNALIKAAFTGVSDEYCKPAGENNGGAETQQCTATPLGYNMGILAVYLLECVDSADNPLPCNSAQFDQISQRITLYEGEQIDLTINTETSDFPAELDGLTSDIEVGAVQVVTAYIEQQFPSVGQEVDRIMEFLQGKSYRICITPESEVDEDTMETRCGHREARKGDYLVDLNGDGVFGFIANVTPTEFEEVDARPANYDGFNDSHFVNNQVCFGGAVGGGDCSLEYTTSDFFDVAGIFAPMMPLVDTQPLAANENYAIDISLNIAATFQWTDGADQELAGPDTVVCALSDSCEPSDPEDADPESVGVYNTFYDTAFLPNVPRSTVVVETL